MIKSKCKYVPKAISGINDCGVYMDLRVDMISVNQKRIACNRQNIHNEAVRSIREDFNFSMCLSIFKHILSGSPYGRQHTKIPGLS